MNFPKELAALPPMDLLAAGARFEKREAAEGAL